MSSNVTGTASDNNLEGSGSKLHFNHSLYETGLSKTPLYEGATISVLGALAETFEWFTAHPGTSKESLSRVLHMQHHSILPSDNMLPDNYRFVLCLCLC